MLHRVSDRLTIYSRCLGQVLSLSLFPSHPENGGFFANFQGENAKAKKVGASCLRNLQTHESHDAPTLFF